MSNQKTIISSENAIELILRGQEIANFHITGTTDFCKIEKELNRELVIQDCFIENLVSISAEYRHSLRLVRSHLNKCSFNYTYFIGGLTIRDCTFDSYLDFEAGGHNQNNCKFQIAQSSFDGFVNFFDCRFQSHVEIVGNEFKRGTNLLGNMDKPFRVQFDSPALIENNRGQIDLDGEGDKFINVITLI
jgi:hypothetical protein